MRAKLSQFALLCGAALAACGCESPSDAVQQQPGAAESDQRERPAAGDRESTSSPAPAKDPPPAPASTAGRAQNKTFDDLKFDIEPDAPYDPSMLTESIEALDGERIRIRGYILPTAQRRGLKEFVLVRDNQECCFGPGAALYDCILVQMAPGKSAEFSIRPVAVTGEFRIDEFRDFEGTTRAVFQMRADEVE